MGYLEHYDELTAKHYSWMSGPLAEKVCTEKARLEALGIGSSGSGKLAVDLGSGPGYQAFALADLGFDRVLAVDTSEDLLGELITNAGGRSVESRFGWIFFVWESWSNPIRYIASHAWATP